MKLRPHALFVSSGHFLSTAIAITICSFAPLAQAQDIIKIGKTTGQLSTLNAGTSFLYNFGVTTTGSAAGLALGSIEFTAGRGVNTTAPVLIQIFNGFGGTGSVVSTISIPASSINQGSAGSFLANLGSQLNLGSGAYSLKVSTTATGNNAEYSFRTAQVFMTSSSGVDITPDKWVQDSNTTGTAGETIAPSAGYVLADKALTTKTVNFGNYRIGSTLTQQLSATNSAFATSSNVTEGLTVSGSATGSASIANLTTSFINQGTSSNFNVSMSSSNVGAQSGNISLNFNSVIGSSASTRTGGPASVGSEIIAVSGVGYRTATASLNTENITLGKFHVGATSVTGNVTLTNTAATDGFSEGLLVSNGGTTGGAILSNLPGSSVIAAGGNSVLAAGFGTIGLGNNSGSITLGLQTSGAGTSGLSAANLASKVINVSAQGYSGQATWNTSGSGTWGSFNSWDETGGTPGVDGSLSLNDTATFGNAISSASTVSINGANPVLKSLVFNHSSAAYTIASGTDGSLTLGNESNAGVLTNSAGTHTIQSNVVLGNNLTVSTAAGSRMNLGGVVSGARSITKTGTGTLVFSGNNTFSGSVQVNQGSIIINGDNSLATGDLTIAAGATLGGSGTIGGNATISGTHNPGNSPGVTNFAANATYTAGSSIVWELVDNTVGGRGTEFDGINVGGDLSFTGATTLDLSFIFTGSTVNWQDEFWSNSITGTEGWKIFQVAGTLSGFENLTLNTSNWLDGSGNAFNSVHPGSSFSLFQSGSDIYLNYDKVAVVPEVSTALMGALASLSLLRRRRA
jgi:fibronectin-binding autotransporter adhesin